MLLLLTWAHSGPQASWNEATQGPSERGLMAQVHARQNDVRELRRELTRRRSRAGVSYSHHRCRRLRRNGHAATIPLPPRPQVARRREILRYTPLPWNTETTVNR